MERNMENKLNTTFENNQKEFTYRKYENKHIESQQAIQSIFNGSIFINCEISKCDFSRCDFEGVKFANTTIQDSIFNNADIKSVYWNHCNFIQCDFSDSYIERNDFNNCTFENCIFSKAAVTNNEFKHNDFVKSNLEKSMFTLNVFIYSSFNNMNLGNCSFYKQIMYKCQYSDIEMNADSLGQIYGLNQKDVENLHYIFLGKYLGNLDKNNYQQLIESFESKQWIYQKIFLDHNINNISTFDLIINIASYFCNCVSNNLILNSDDLQFFYLVIDFLSQHQQLPLFALIYAYQQLLETLSNLNSDDFQYKSAKEILIKIQYKIHEMIEHFYSKVEYLDSNEYIEISIRYESENNNIINFAELINEFNKILGIQNRNPAILLKTENGSIIEVIGTTLLGIFSFQFALYGINGILVQTLQLKSNIQLLKSKNPPKNILDLSKKGQQIQPDFINIINNLNIEVINALSKLAEKIKNILIK